MGYTPIELDKTRNLRYGMKAISLVEKKLGQPIAKIDMDNLTMEDSAALVWAGLVHEDSELTPDKVMDLIDDYSSFQSVMVLAGTALTEAFGDGEQGGQGKKKRAASSK